MRRKEAAFKCQGNTVKARRQFWKYVGGKSKKSTGFTALRDPESGAVKCGATDMLRITENFIKEIFSDSALWAGSVKKSGCPYKRRKKEKTCPLC